jgi:hypothetical protein
VRLFGDVALPALSFARPKKLALLAKAEDLKERQACFRAAAKCKLADMETA